MPCLTPIPLSNSPKNITQSYRKVFQERITQESSKCFTPLPEDLTLKHRAEGMEAKLSPVHLLLMSIFRIDPKSYSQLYPEEVRKTCE